jgi:hypothetical protein
MTQADRQQSARNVTGTTLTPEGDALALMAANGVSARGYNGSLVAWINGSVLGTSYPDLPGSMAALAAAHGYYSWDAMTSLMVGGGPLLAGDASITADNNYLLADGNYYTADVGALTADTARYLTDRA